jgi:GNAT superfamily N-acetyltransferase
VHRLAKTLSPEEVVIQTVTKGSLSPKDLRQLCFLSFGSEGLMEENLRRANPSHRIVLARHGERIVGWTMHLAADTDTDATFGIYVARRYRRNGIGTRLSQTLVEDMQAQEQRVCFQVHNNGSCRFGGHLVQNQVLQTGQIEYNDYTGRITPNRRVVTEPTVAEFLSWVLATALGILRRKFRGCVGG